MNYQHAINKVRKVHNTFIMFESYFSELSKLIWIWRPVIIPKTDRVLFGSLTLPLPRLAGRKLQTGLN